MARTTRPRLCDAGCGRPVRKRRGARYCSPCVAKKTKKLCVECEQQFAPDMMNGPRCRPCASSKAHSKRIEQTFSITGEQYAAILEAQGGVCYICRRKPGLKRLACDHDHSCCPGPTSCGKCLRGLLCRSCNRDLLGHLKDSVAALYRAIDYLEDWPARRALRNLTECDDDTTLA